MSHLKRILLAEDDPHDVELTITALAKRNLANEVIVARDGEEALDYLYLRGPFESREPGNPAVVLLDLKMPKVNGVEVLKTIKADPALKQIPVVVLTSSREDPDVVQCYQLGVNAYVVKPVDFHEFVDAVSEMGLFWGIINVPPPSGS
ncbi:MAG TPA: response regulator [Blastocatellia bacterium]|nr:response regulator [Blastocatellia bacterium]